MDDIIWIDNGGTKYKLEKEPNGRLKSLGQGGQAKVYLATVLGGKRQVAIKRYTSDVDNTKKQHIARLCSINPIMKPNGTIDDRYVLPETIIQDFREGFAYVMQYVPLKKHGFLTVKNKHLFSKLNTSPAALLRVLINISEVFNILHWGKHKQSGVLAYKDLNEENVFVNPNTGDIRLIDNDNLGAANQGNIKGTFGYMAPEIIDGKKPDIWSDQFSLAVLLFKGLLVGTHPFYGANAEELCKTGIKENGLDVYANRYEKSALNKWMLSDPVFIFHPKDLRNRLEKCRDSELRSNANTRKTYWELLPDEVKNAFIKTFTQGLEQKTTRTQTSAWVKIFNQWYAELIPCKCNELNFANTCCYKCGKTIEKKTIPKLHTSQKKIATLATTIVNGIQCNALTSKKIDLVNGQTISGSDFGNEFKKYDIKAMVVYKDTKKCFCLKNIGTQSWYVRDINKNVIELTTGKLFNLSIVGRNVAFVKGILQVKVL
ncbi:MAG: protein kinase [Chitinispirillales bacterium]|jgi:serine/threonine protein kinase|nr:protein kinase [Chitinispirillales bacterium]